MESRIMYIEQKPDGVNGPARIGRVTFSKSGHTLYYGGKTLERIHYNKANYIDTETDELYWISGCKKDGRTVCIEARSTSMMM